MTGDDIKTIRQQLGLTQAELANRINAIDPNLRIAATSVSRWESGKHQPSAHVVAAIRTIEREESQLRSYTLHRLPDGSGVVVCRRGPLGPVIGGQAGFYPDDVDEAIQQEAAGGEVHLSEWGHLEITQPAAEFVAASYPAVAG